MKVDEPVQSPFVADDLPYGGKPPPADDEWVAERAHELAWAIVEERRDIEQTLAAFGQEAISRTRESERVLALERQLAVQRMCLQVGRDELLVRLKNPDEVLVDAVAKASLPDDAPAWEDRTKLVRDSCRHVARDGIRALADRLEQEG